MTRRDEAWVTDITHIRTWQGSQHPAVVVGSFSRKVIGWAAGPTIYREVVLNAAILPAYRQRPRRTSSILTRAHIMAARRPDASVGAILESPA